MGKEGKRESALKLVGIVAEIVECYMMSEREICERNGITQGEGKLISKISTGEPVYVNSLSEDLGLSKSRISRLIESMRNKGIVAKSENENDHRFNNLVLTEKGKKIKNLFLEDRVKRCLEIITPISEDHISQLIPLLGVLKAEFSKYKEKL
jgi:DNA-binding MarR family transcriptional regulator